MSLNETESAEINTILSNIFEEKRYKHCRICLKNIGMNFAKFADSVVFDNELITLSKVLVKIFGIKVIEDVPGIDVICSSCVDEAVKTFKFIEKYENSSKKLQDVIDNISFLLNTDIDTSNKEPAYIVLNEGDCRLVRGKHRQIEVSNESTSCSECSISLDTVEELAAHNSRVHDRYTCEQCLFTSSAREAVAEHIDSSLILKCKYSPVAGNIKTSLTEHKESIHFHIIPQTDKIIKQTESKTKYKNNPIKICPKCGKSYATTEFYMKHVKLCNEGKVVSHPMRSEIRKRYFCEECGKGYSTPGGLRVHERFVHGDAKPHVCDVCGKMFTAPSYLKAHQITHTGEKNYTCDICSKKFVTKEALLYHTRRHTGEKPYQCNRCQERFVNSSARADHIKHKHIGPTLSCNYCSRKFVTKNFLRLHMMKHYDPTNKLYIGCKVTRDASEPTSVMLL